MWDTIVVLEEGNRPYPCCPRYKKSVPWQYMDKSLPATLMCTRGVERKRRHLVEEEAHTGSATASQAYGRPLAFVSSFKYLGRILIVLGEYLMTAVADLRKARQKWDCMLSILGQ